MFIPVISDLAKLRIYNSKFLKFLNLYLVLSSLFFLFKSVSLIYTLNGLLISLLSFIIFPVTLLLYPLLLVFTENYNPFFMAHAMYFYLPLGIRMITKNDKRRYF